MVPENSFAVAHSAHRVAAPVEARVLAAPGPACHGKKRKASSAKTPAGQHCSQACTTPPVKATWQCRQRPWEEPLEMKGRVPECVLTNRRVEGVPVFEYWACLNTGLTTVVSQFCQMSGTTGQQPRGVSHTPAGPAVKTAHHTDHHHMLQQ